MCGIFGILSQRGVSQDLLDSAARSLAHRGPDDSGTTVIATDRGQLGLAHTRLSIIDLSPLGHQPMRDPATGNWIVFNGEIYSFRELRAELESNGFHFQSHSDTEVILAAYSAWGEAAFSRLRGMFALAIWDAAGQHLLLARDPMGIKPLYYFHSDNIFLFASEVRTLLQTGLVPKKLDSDGLFSFLAFGSIYEPRSIVEGISAVPAGSVIKLDKNGIQQRQFWTPLSAASKGSTEGYASDNSDEQGAQATIDSLPKLLRDAVVSHLVSDVPIGVFLSGGIDSSSLVALMSQAGIRASTFSLVFREEEFNEAQHSRAVASLFSTDHHEIMVSEQDAFDSLPVALRAMDQPTIDGINTWLVSAKTRAEGVKVALTGLGADELFAGYSNFRRVPRMERAAARFAMVPSAIRKPMAASVGLLAGKGDRGRKLSLLAAGGEAIHPYFLLRSLFTVAEREKLYSGKREREEHQLQNLEQASLAACQSLDPVNRVSYLESTCYMRNTLLRDSDFMSMAHALELRVPFLDPALVKACFRIPGKEKLSSTSPKTLLLQSLGVELPRDIVHRPKRGFTLPFERWMRGELRSTIEQTLREDSALDSCLNPRAVADVWRRFLAGETSWSRPWSLFVLRQWCRQNL
jgi:asparagine synthase (glutamine-hydrolysing)